MNSSARLDQYWMAFNRRKFIGRWVALENGVLLASGDSAKSVYDEAKRNGAECPLIALITEEIAEI